MEALPDSAPRYNKIPSLRYLKSNQTKFITSLLDNIVDFKSALLEKREQLDMEYIISEHDYFLVSKHQIVEENILYTSKVLFELLEKELHVDELFLLYAQKRNITLNLNIERTLYLALTLLFSMNLVLNNQNMLKRNPL
ncbi:hypothetical protein [Brevibacillus sp. HB1.2]|uniref:hypothetical protein n=1 Tax=Brevibacillus sp. HB1.2 TaxID=2738807 RepID=UPI0020C61FA2|nr:hypothetical protein [Brevibacillus sp. HB1.2]